MTFRSHTTAIAYAIALAGGAPETRAQTELEVWPTGVNGPQTWPADLHNPWWDTEHKYPEGGQPLPVDLFDRIKCTGSKVTPKSANSAPWETSRWHPPEYAFDKYTMSRWSSNGAADKWIAADMGATKSVNRVYLVWEVAYGKDYDIQFSDDSASWTTAKQVRGGNGQADVVDLDGKGRYIRMMGVATGSPYGYSLYEFTICAADGSTSIGRQGRGSAEGKSTDGSGAGAKGWRLSMSPQGLPLALRAYDVQGKVLHGIPASTGRATGMVASPRP